MRGPATVRLTSGDIRGLRTDGCLAFRGIPYAAPPVGELRWRPPEPDEPWTGVRDATESGNPAPQLPQSFADVAAYDEDCLYLDVTVPEAPVGSVPEAPGSSGPEAAVRSGAGLPVMVWLHGGGGTSDSGSMYDPRPLALAGDVVVVTPNFRLGILGCFGYPGLTDGGTFGLQDQQAVLRWVRREIAQFGGDPNNVTLFGESYGAFVVAAHLTAPASAGLFHRAILQSAFAVTGEPTPAHTFIPGIPAIDPMWSPMAELEQLGVATAEQQGWVEPGSDPGPALARLRQVPVPDLLAASAPFTHPAFGGATLPERPDDALRAGRFSRVPVLLGSTRDEARFFVGLFAESMGNPVTTETYPRLLADAFGDAADEVAAHYPLDSFDTPGLAWAEVATDRAWALPTWDLGRLLATHTPTWFYEFADRDAPTPVPLPGFPSGALHASELAYQFDLPGAASLGEAQRELAEAMKQYWTAFAAHGDPHVAGLPAWPGFGSGHAWAHVQPYVQSLAPGAIGRTDYEAEHRLDFWDQLR